MNLITVLAIGPFQILILIIPVLIIVLPTWFFYKKAGKPGWASIVPFYSTLIWLKIIGKPWYWLILFLIPYVNLIFLIWATNLTSKSYGKEQGFAFGLIFLPLIFYPILAFGSSKYDGPAGK